MMHAIRRALARAVAWLQCHRAELLTGCCWLTGWALLTAAIVERSVWYASGGLLAVSLGGWRTLWTVVTHGLAALSRGTE